MKPWLLSWNSGSILAIFLLTVYVAECIWFVQTQSLTYDEPVHIAEGLDAWRNHRFENWNDHPTLARLWCTLPLLSDRNQVEVEPLEAGWRVTRLEPNPQSLASRARLMNVMMGLILAILVWRTTGKMFSLAAANLVLALFVFSPSLIAHFSLVTTDGVAALFVFATAVSLVRWRERPDYLHTVLFGIVLGLLLLAKFSTPVMFAVALIWMLISRGQASAFNPLHWNWSKSSLAIIVAMLIVWFGYFFHISHLTIRDRQLSATFPNRPTIHFNNVRTDLRVNLLVPAGEYLEGLRNVVRRNRQGQPSFFLGRVSQEGGFRAYYPVAVLLKWPLIVVLLFGFSLFLLVTRRVRAPSGFWVMMSFPMIYFIVALFARFDIGERHILPVYPFVLLSIGAVWEFLRPGRFAIATALLMTILLVVDTSRYAPDYLSYFNFYVRRENTYKFLTDSNVDWGQGLLALKKYLETHPGEQVSLSYFGSVDPAFYGISVRRLAEGERTTGTVIVSATNLSGQYLQNANSMQWVTRYSPPTMLLNHSLYVFHIPEK